jgi:hypothetical protein
VGHLFLRPNFNKQLKVSAVIQGDMMKKTVQRTLHAPATAVSSIGMALLLQFGVCHTALAIDIDTGNPELKLRWDNTFKYSAAARLEGRKAVMITDDPANNQGTINLDDGDRNFSKGLISNRVDLLTEFDLKYQDKYGLRVSGAAWYDRVYNRPNDNNDASRANQSSTAYNQFTNATRNLHGRKAEILDAFVFGSADIAGMPTTVRLGKHSLLYGETLFFGANGIANAQAPVDVVKLLSVPGSQFKEIILPVNQVSSQIQILPNLALGGYYQFEFRKSRIPAVGSYFSGADVFDDGAENFLFAPGLGAPRTGDLKARDKGQFGFQLRWRPESMDTEFGAYAVRYHDKLFQAYLRANPLFAAPGPFNFQLVYPEDIKSYGLSFSTSVGDFNVAGEGSIRRNTPLVSGPQIDPSITGSAGIGANALYAVGSSAHLNLSTLYLLSSSSMWDGGSFLGEIGWNRRTSVKMNEQAIDPNSSRDAWGMRFIFEPQWFQVFPQMDISVPLGLGYNPRGNSSVVQQFNGGTRKGGDMSIGLKGTYQQQWRFGLTYNHFIGAAGAALGADAHLSFKQNLADRDFISLSVQTSF